MASTYTNGSMKSEFYGYADACFVNNHDLTLTSSNVFILNSSTITWGLKQELTPTLSTIEAEFNLMVCTEKDIIYVCSYKTSTKRLVTN